MKLSPPLRTARPTPPDLRSRGPIIGLALVVLAVVTQQLAAHRHRFFNASRSPELIPSSAQDRCRAPEEVLLLWLGLLQIGKQVPP